MFKFSRNNRLLNKKEYDLIFNQSKKIKSDDFIFFLRKTDVHFARLGLAITKRKIPKSHDRNRIKRLIRETFRLHQLVGLDVVVVVKHELNCVSNVTLINQLGKIWDGLKQK